MINVGLGISIFILSMIAILVGISLDKKNISDKSSQFLSPKKKIIMGVLIFNISLLTTYLAMVGVNYIASQRIPYGSIIGELDISKLTIAEAFSKLDQYYPKFLKNRSLTLDIEEKIYQIPLDQISCRLDVTKTKENIIGSEGTQRITYNLGAIFAKKERKIMPVFICDVEKLTEKIKEIKTKADQRPIDAHVILQNDVVEKKQEIHGVDLNIEKAVIRSIAELEAGNLGPIKLKNTSDGEYVSKKPKAVIADIDKIDSIVGKAYTNIEYSSNLKWIENSIKAINNIYIPQKDFNGNYKVAVFSFFDCLEKEGHRLESYQPGVNQVASTAYLAFIRAGLPPESFEIVADIEGSEYTPETKKIKVVENTIDLKYKNNLDSPLIIMAEIKDNMVVVKILGQKK